MLSLNFQKISFLNLIIYIRILGLTVFLLAPSFWTNAQDTTKSSIPLDHFYVKRNGPSLFRRILKDVHFGVNTGLGKTYFNHQLSSYGIYQAPGGSPEIFSGSTNTRYSNWITNVVEDKTSTVAGSYVDNSSGLGFKGSAINIPLALSVHYAKGRIRVGGGYSYELIELGKFRPTSHGDKIATVSPSGSGLMRKYYGMVGVALYRYNEYLLVGDLQVGSFKPKSFNTGVITPSMYYNLGLTIERDFSEYFKAFIRPAYEIKSYSIGMPGGGGAIDHHMNGLYLTVGVTYSIPELPRCFIKECYGQVNHAHGNKEYRSRQHPIYKKQNPNYGENYPTLIKYKGKNKNKLNPY